MSGFFDESFTETITKASQSGVGSDGEPTYGAISTLKARIQRGKDRNETDIPHSMVLYVGSAVLVTDRVWLPEDSTESADAARVPQSVQYSKALEGGDELWKILI